MNFEELLVRFLDGQTAPIEDEELMSQLAVSPDKRTLLRTHLAMRDAMKLDAGSLRPSRTLRDGTVAMLIAAAGAERVIDGMRVRPNVARSWIKSAGMLGTGLTVGALTMYALGPASHAGSSPTPVVAPIVSPQEVAPAQQPDAVLDLPAKTVPLRVQRETVIVPETVRVASPAVVIHDTVVVAAPQQKVMSVPPTVTIQRDTVYLQTKK